ncbi:MAG: hypothetical protein ABII26_12005 [Pseudomonadota bacterium]
MPFDNPPKRFPVSRTPFIEDLLTRALLSIVTWVFLFIIAKGMMAMIVDKGRQCVKLFDRMLLRNSACIGDRSTEEPGYVHPVFIK